MLPLTFCSWVTAADLDGDGRPELVASKYQNDLTYETESAIFWNGPDGFSKDRVTWLPTRGTIGCTTGDLDGDGKPDLIACVEWSVYPYYCHAALMMRARPACTLELVR